jgi:hypothetical protein
MFFCGSTMEIDKFSDFRCRCCVLVLFVQRAESFSALARLRSTKQGGGEERRERDAIVSASKESATVDRMSFGRVVVEG